MGRAAQEQPVDAAINKLTGEVVTVDERHKELVPGRLRENLRALTFSRYLRTKRRPWSEIPWLASSRLGFHPAESRSMVSDQLAKGRSLLMRKREALSLAAQIGVPVPEDNAADALWEYVENNGLVVAVDYPYDWTIMRDGKVIARTKSLPRKFGLPGQSDATET